MLDLVAVFDLFGDFCRLRKCASESKRNHIGCQNPAYAKWLKHIHVNVSKPAYVRPFELSDVELKSQVRHFSYV